MSTDQHLARVPSPEALPSGGRLPRLAAQVASEVTRYRRLPEYFIGVVVLPVILFAMFGLPNAGTTLPGGTTVVALLFVSFSCYGVVSQSLFSFGAELAAEREAGWLRRLRATPMPMSVYFAGKLAVNLVFTLLIAIATAFLGRARPLSHLESDSRVSWMISANSTWSTFAARRIFRSRSPMVHSSNLRQS